jgi:RNA polymerase sigma factor (TIGR02999 family)
MGLTKDDDGLEDCATTVTRLLNEAGTGDPAAARDLLPLVYKQLRAMAARRMRQERPDQTLQATALVHEAYLRLVDEADVQKWDNRWHFFAAAGDAMRRILVDNARRRAALKRGGGARRVSLDNVELSIGDPPDDMVALDEALTKFTTTHPEKAQLVNLRYFAGLSMEQAAEAMGISDRTARRNWAYARAWLFSHITSDRPACDG